MLAKEKIVIGISGVTNAGKTSLSLRLQKALPNCKVIHQDDFFKPPEEVVVDSNGFYQYDVITALNMDAMMNVVNAWIKDPSGFKGLSSESHIASQPLHYDPDAPHILIIEGFLMYTYRPLLNVFDFRYLLTVPFDEAKRRRSTRVYCPADPPGYFEGHVWPMHLEHKEEIRSLGVHVEPCLDGTSHPDELFRLAYDDISAKVRRLSSGL
ncbi:nicotinamide riboside kinase 1-like isoform X1 [Lethenteron reissneri]|uniref:nicotinamide riboside kinase 1-like isoform X1 n=1 Tax=Lethenteron reissneri TaxID=7753 RepID=UPI002AB60375|nr:nicotinamide riboside kinase 1-like isoform X1 [Lethenteron reissneri]